MKFIKLTAEISNKKIRVNVDHIVEYGDQLDGSGGYIITMEGTTTVTETSEEIDKLAWA